MAQETGFEKTRGVSRVEVKSGFAQVHVRELTEPIMDARLSVLKSIANAGISIDFLKLTPDGLSCIITEAQSEKAAEALKSANVEYAVATGRSVLLVFAVNMRDEEGLIAQVVQEAIRSGKAIEHISDMHDRMLLVTLSEHANDLKNTLVQELVDSGAGGRR